jgi:hypothetical protein
VNSCVPAFTPTVSTSQITMPIITIGNASTGVIILMGY